MIRRKSKARPLAFAALCLSLPFAAGAQAGAAETHPATVKSAASVSGTINWWGWTPTDSAEATSEIAAFNKVYPNIKVNFKLITIANYVTAMRPALVSGQGPDLFELQPGAYVTEFNSFATNLNPVASAGPRRRLEIEGRADRYQRLHLQRQPHCAAGRLGVRRYALGRRRLVQEVQPLTADHAGRMGKRL